MLAASAYTSSLHQPLETRSVPTFVQVAKKAFDVVARNSLRGITDILSERFKGNAEVRQLSLPEPLLVPDGTLKMLLATGLEAEGRAGTEGRRAVLTCGYLRSTRPARQLCSARSSQCGVESLARHRRL